MKTDSKWLKTPWTAHHHPSRLETGVTSRTNSPANETLNGGQDIKLSALSMMDISYTLKTKPPEKYDPVM